MRRRAAPTPGAGPGRAVAGALDAAAHEARAVASGRAWFGPTDAAALEAARAVASGSAWPTEAAAQEEARAVASGPGREAATGDASPTTRRPQRAVAWLLALGVATAAWAGAPDAGVSPAAALNTAGFRLYQQKKYAEALEQFKQAIAADEQHALSHYNYAATLALLRKQGRVCEFDAYCPVVLDHLERAVQLDEGRRRRMQRDPYFDTVRDTVRYQRLLGRDPAREADARALLVAVTWLGAAPGAFGNMAELRFKADGTFTLSRKVLDDQGEVKTVKVSGRFTVRRFDVTLELGSPLDGKKKLSGRLGADGRLSLDALGELSDERAECDA